MSLFSNLKMSHHQKIQQILTHIHDLAMSMRPTMQIQMKPGNLQCTLQQLPGMEMKALKLAQVVV